jgi:hypothetical protein
VYSLVDHDVYAQRFTLSGQPVAGSGTWIDVTSDYWIGPKVAKQTGSPDSS